MFCLGAWQEEATLETLVRLCNKELGGMETVAAVQDVNLMVK